MTKKKLMINVLINGSKGKMGAMIAEVIKNNPHLGLQLICARDMGEPVCADKVDVIIDFSLPDGAKDAFRIAKEKKCAILVGTTNLPADFFAQLKAEKEIPVFYSTNVSIGVYMFGLLCKYATELYKGYEQSMQEIHHIHKLDAPSGTAKTLASIINFPYEKIESLREGEVPGIHSLFLDTPYEKITLTHEAKKRALFAESAVLVAKWLTTQKPGFYGMEDYVKTTRS